MEIFMVEESNYACIKNEQIFQNLQIDNLQIEIKDNESLTYFT